ncbi:hypothetical protein B0H66DRAFT_599972 [Apodospora peruviana]|uniref:Uncharacterized protein n=1 Tax=Apodospora peruviana TaxID=516989 RepID=A0AAE0MAY7_9PEZI|nr:hypothetical protein B0H66DRAFT_599972 [Apodospora peruviana]
MFPVTRSVAPLAIHRPRLMQGTPQSFTYLKMPAITPALVARDSFSHIAKRNWASQEAGVIVVFCIVFVVAVGLIALFISKKLSARKAAKQSS